MLVSRKNKRIMEFKAKKRSKWKNKQKHLQSQPLCETKSPKSKVFTLSTSLRSANLKYKEKIKKEIRDYGQHFLEERPSKYNLDDGDGDGADEPK